MATNLDLGRLIHDRLADTAIDAVVTVKDGDVWLEGTVELEDFKLAAEAIVAGVDQTLRVHNYLEVISLLLPFQADELEIEPETDRLTGALRAIDVGAVEQVKRNPEAAMVGREAELPESEVPEPYFAPTDPVVRTGPYGLEVLGGFAGTSVDEVAEDVHDAELAHVRGDEEIAEDVVRELAEDAMTTDLVVRVYVRNGVVHLRGQVRSLDDAEAAEEVAGRVPGVVEVHEELEI